MKVINKSKLEEKLIDLINGSNSSDYKMAIFDVYNMLDFLSREQQTRKAYWKLMPNDRLMCSCCGCYAYAPINEPNMSGGNYCQNCGALMTPDTDRKILGLKAKNEKKNN